MRAHHAAWLKKHEEQPLFLRQCIDAGFDVHHVDGDRENNAPENLVLIFSRDHADLHGLPTGFVRDEEKAAVTRSRKKAEKGKAAYQMKQIWGVTWSEVSRRTGIKSPLNSAKHYAAVEGKPWPIDNPRG